MRKRERERKREGKTNQRGHLCDGFQGRTFGTQPLGNFLDLFWFWEEGSIFFDDSSHLALNGRLLERKK